MAAESPLFGDQEERARIFDGRLHHDVTANDGVFDPADFGFELKPVMLPVRYSPAQLTSMSKASPADTAPAAKPHVEQPAPRTIDQTPSQSSTALRLQRLKEELSGSRADEERLNAENDELRTEVEKWRAVAARVSEREAKAVVILEQVSAASSGALAAPELVLPANISMLARAKASVGHFSSLASKSMPRNHFLWQAMTSMAICVTLWAVWSALGLGAKISKTRPDWQDFVAKAEGLRSRFSGARYKVEVGEIHVGSLLGGGDVQVSLSVGGGPASCTEVIRRSDGSFLRFGETFAFELRKGGSPLLLQVIDGRGKLARLELPATEAINLACREQCQFFRSELIAEEALLQDMDGKASSRRPYAAMRIRDVTPKA